MSYHTTSSDKKLFSDALIRWYKIRARSLPWRTTNDPYHIWISEMMLQQTQVKTVIDYFNRFIQRYPDIYHLANASLDEVLSYWSGLGYYQRARYIHQTALIITRDFQGQFPRTYEKLIALPGIGRYTAGAILSIAFNQNYPILDGNVKRVLSRYLGIQESLRMKSTEDTLWRIAADFIPKNQAGIFNSSMMELGALICKPKSTECLCHQCPVKLNCVSYRENKVHLIPVLPRNSKKEYLELHFFLAVYNKEHVLMGRLEKSSIVQSMWEIPNRTISKNKTKVPSTTPPQTSQNLALCKLIQGNSSSKKTSPIKWTYVAKTKHAITHKHIQCLLYKTELTHADKIRLDAFIKANPNYAFMNINEILDIPHSSLMKKMLYLYKQQNVLTSNLNEQGTMPFQSTET